MRVGFIGLGNMGSPMAKHLLDAGHALTVYDVRKDIGLATDLAREFGVPLKIGNLVEQDHIEAMSRGWGDRDSTVPFALQEERAGVKVRKAKA